MTNNYGVPLSVALTGRIQYFFGANANTTGYRIFKAIWLVLFTIPFLAESIVEFLVLTTLYIIGKFFGSLSLLGLLPALLMGVIYTLFNYFFMFLFAFFTLPDVLSKAALSDGERT